MSKVVIITDAWEPQINGVVTVLLKMKQKMEERGFEVTVIHPGLFRSTPFFFYPEIRIPFFLYRDVGNLITKQNPDFIHIATEGALGIAARSICVGKGLTFTTSYHTHFSHYTKARIKIFFGTVFAYLRWFHNAGAVTMVSTSSLKTELEKHGFSNVVLWPLGVDIELFKRNDQSPHQDLEKPVFVYFGRLAVEKGVEEYFKCNLPGTKLVIGDGPLRKKLQKTYGKQFKFVGYQHGQNLVDWLSVCDVFVFPSRTETFGLVALEAMACGVRVAAHDVMGPRDIISQGIDGYLDENLERAALQSLALLQSDCRQKAESYSWEASADAFIGHLKNSSISSDATEISKDNFAE